MSITLLFSKKKRKEFTFNRLDEHLKRAREIPFDLKKGKCVIFSDAHKWDRGKKDYFKANERLYLKLLDYYLGNKFILVLNGDIEEGQGSKLETVVKKYPDTFKSENKFKNAGKYYRIYGNHDHSWKDDHVRWKLLYQYFGIFDVSPAYRIGEKIIIFHGHEGDIWSDYLRGLAGIGVRLGKRIFGSRKRAAKNYKIRNIRENWLSEWAEKKDILLIAGHTHRPMFKSMSVEENFQVLKNVLTGTRSFEEYDNTIIVQKKLFPKDKEIEIKIREKERYYNTGGCMFCKEKDRISQITCIEIADKKIRLLKWKLENGNLKKEWKKLSNDLSWIL